MASLDRAWVIPGWVTTAPQQFYNQWTFKLDLPVPLSVVATAALSHVIASGGDYSLTNADALVLGYFTPNTPPDSPIPNDAPVLAADNVTSIIFFLGLQGFDGWTQGAFQVLAWN